MSNIWKKIISAYRKILNESFKSIVRSRLLEKYSLSNSNVFAKQSRMLKIILLYANKHCGYYKKLGLSNVITEFPIIHKSDISAEFENFCSDELGGIFHVDAYTGGSTGEPFHFYQSYSAEYEFELLKWKHYGYKHGDKILAMDGTKIPAELLTKNVYWAKESENGKELPYGSFCLSSLYLNGDNAIYYCKYINQFKPTFMRGYPSFIYSIACYAEELNIKFEFKMKGVELTSESAYQYQIDKIKEVFNTNVYLQYGHTEAIAFGYTYDETYRYKIEPLYGYIEILDSNGKHVAVGEEGEIVVTTLHNYAMPLIRYCTGDRAVYGGRDKRYIYLDSILGRTQDYVVNKNNDKVLLTALIFGQHCAALGKITKWQIEQFEPGIMKLKIIKGKNFGEEDEKEILELFTKVGNVDTNIQYVDSIPVTGRGKSKMIVQHLDL